MGGIPTTTTLRNHPGFWMRSDAEASLARWEADHGTISVNSAGRTEAEQQRLIDRWDAGGKYNRPPYLFGPKRPARASSHVYEGGIAFDTSEWQRFLRTCADYGWYQRYSWDVVHFEYVPANDKYRNQAAGGNASRPAAPDPIILEDEMILIESLPERGRAVVGPGYFRKLRNSEELVQASKIVSRTVKGNARQFDVWKSIALSGSAPSVTVSLTDAQLSEIADAAREGGADAIAGLEFVITANN